MQAKYVIFDGLDGSGKGTQIERLKNLYSTDSAVFTFEPGGGSPIADEIRKLVRDNPISADATPMCNLLLFMAAREDSNQCVVAPALKEGKHVFSDRGDSSTFAFQIYGEQHLELRSIFGELRDYVYNPFRLRRKPDLYVILDVPAQVARERALADKNRGVTHYDARDLEFYQRVREGFIVFKQAAYGRVEFIDGTKSPDEVSKDILDVLTRSGVHPSHPLAGM